MTVRLHAGAACLRLVTWNVARRVSGFVAQATALGAREPDVVALQEVTRRTVPLWQRALALMGLVHVRTSLDDTDRSRAPAARRSIGVILASRAPLGDGCEPLPVPWPETALSAVASTTHGLVELYCVHVPNAANGWVKVETLRAIRRGLAAADPAPRVLCGDHAGWRAVRQVVVDSAADAPWEKCARRAVPLVAGDLLSLAGEGGRTQLTRAQHLAAQRRAEQIAGRVDQAAVLADPGLEHSPVSTERWQSALSSAVRARSREQVALAVDGSIRT